VQAIGYIYAVGFQFAKNLRVFPFEVIGLVFNIILLIKVLFYSTCNPCHRLLVIYMDGDWELEVDEFNDNDQIFFPEYYDLNKIQVVIYFAIFIGLMTLLVYCSVSISKFTNVMMVLPIIAFVLGFCLNFLGFQFLDVDIYNNYRRGVYIVIVGFLVNLVAYIWTIVGTMLY